MKGLAAILVEQNQPLVIDEVEMPKLGVGQVLIDNRYTGICGAQIREIDGAKGPDKFLPHLLGHEAAGYVHDVGPGVKKVKPGDHVVCHWRRGSGIEAEPAKYVWGDKIVGSGPIATWAERFVISENRITKITKDFSFDLASLFGCALTTGLGIVCNEAQLKIGQNIAVIGLGGVGLSVVMGAYLAGANKIMGIERNYEKFSDASSLGANILQKELEVKQEDLRDFDFVVDFTGNSYMISQSVDKLLKDGGMFILAGQPKYNSNLIINNFENLYRGIKIIDSQGGLTNPDIDIPRYIDFFRNRAVIGFPSKLISRSFCLSGINEAIAVMKTGKENRVLIKC